MSITPKIHGIIMAVAIAAAASLAAAADAGPPQQRNEALILARATLETGDRQPAQCSVPGGKAAGGGLCLAATMRLSRGAECPASSGAYCSDEFPYCCGTPGNYYCAKDVNSC